MATRNPKRLKILLTAFILITVGFTVVVFVFYRQVRQDPKKLMSVAAATGAGQILGKVNHTATRDGRKEWTLEAGSARIMEDKKEVVFKDLSVVFFMEDGQEVYLTAEQGVLQTESKDIVVTGNVVVHNESYRLETEKLEYERRRHVLMTDQPVEILGEVSSLAADSMAFDLRTNKTFFKGSVQGVFREDFAL